MEARLRDALGGRLQAVLLEGEPGIGKTRLLTWAQELGEALGFRSFMGHCDELASSRPFGPLVDAFGCRRESHDPRRSAIARALVDHRPEDRFGAGHFVITDAFADLIEEEALTGAVAMVVDDLQWADASTLYVLESLSRRLSYVPVAFLGAIRAVPRPPGLERLIQRSLEEGGHLLHVGPLLDDEIRALVERTVGSTPGSGLLQQVSRAAGNPLLIHELLDSLDRDQAIEVKEGVADAGDTQLPRDLRLTVLRRISFLSVEAIEMLRFAALLGSRFSPGHLAAMLKRPVVDLVPAIDEAIQAEILLEGADELRFRHDLIREALYHDIAGPVRKALHRDIAIALEGEGAPPQEVAHHHALGAPQGDPRAISALRVAARSPSLAPETRVDLLRRAYDIANEGTEERDICGAELAEALIWAGSPDDGRLLAGGLLQHHENDDLGRSLMMSSLHALYVAGRLDELVTFANDRLSRERLVEYDRMILLAYRSMALAFTHKDKATLQASVDAEEALDWAERHGDDRVRVLALHALHVAAEWEYRHSEALRYGQRAVEIVRDSSDDHVRQLDMGEWVAQSLTMTGHLDEAIRMLRDGITEKQRAGAVWNLPIYHHFLGATYCGSGDWDDAIATFQAGLAAMDEIGTQLPRTAAHVWLGMIALDRNRLDEAEAHVRYADSMETELGPQWRSPRGLEASLLAARGEVARAIDQMRALTEQRSSVLNGSFFDWIAVLYGLGELDLGRAVLAAVQEQFRRDLARNPDGRILACKGLLDGDADTAIQGIEVLEAIPDWQAGIAKEFAAIVMAKSGRIDEATPLFRAALAVCEELGAERLVARVTANARAVGIRLARAATRGRPRFGWEALTDAELRVTGLAADGLTNRRIADHLFVSRHTIQTHLKHIFTKLEISSRVQLAAEVARHSDAPRP